MSFLRFLSNLVVTLALVAGVAVLIDWVSITMGGAPHILCATLPVLGIAAPGLGIVTMLVGLLSILTSRRRAYGVAILLAGVAMWQLPELVGTVVAPRC